VKLRSLHAQFVAGVAIWTIGLISLASAVGYAIMLRSPRSAMFVHESLLALVGAALVTAGLAVLRRGLSPFRLLRDRLASVRDGQTTRLVGEYPTEVEPLVSDLNALLDEREQRISRAVAKAGDLAHGLKTPLAVLAQDVERAQAAGQHDLAESVRRQVERMRRQIESHLVHARATASGRATGARANVADAARGLVRTMEQLYADRALIFTVDVPEELAVRVPIEDLEEMLGNLLDNACKWARSSVGLAARASDGSITVHVDDDGAGLHPSMLEQVLQRGVRADETAPGSGLGLAIVRDLAEVYGGSIALERSPEGGVRARLTLRSQA
jgi:signal transduction histidine kinase